jgi:hypothetical protein
VGVDGGGGGGYLKWKSSACRHGIAVSRAGVGRGGREPGPAVAAGGQNGVGGPEPVDCSVLHAQRHDTPTDTLIVHDQVQGKILDCRTKARSRSQRKVTVDIPLLTRVGCGPLKQSSDRWDRRSFKICPG